MFLSLVYEINMSTYEISQSSLLSLKAEILRKQQELTKSKNDNEPKIKVFKKNTPLEIKNKGVEARNKADQLKEEEDQDLLRKSRSQLELKSKLYERLSEGNAAEQQINNLFLVRFDDKKKTVKTSDMAPNYFEDEADRYPDSEGEYYNSGEDEINDPAEKWVEYVDCLGRTRTCLQKDLEYLKSKDEKLRSVVESKKQVEDQNSELIVESHEENQIPNNDQISEESELLSSDMRRELLRQQWEKEEDNLRNKSNIHYQDILFGEARTHGVGYYAFSKDEAERLKQQEALKNIRQETEQKQKRAQELKALREKQLAARIKAAKDRKRARLGLPPEEDKPEPPPEPAISEEEKNQQEEELRKKETVEKMLEEARKQHIRPWDIGKDGVKEHYEMSQEEWVAKKRSERPNEFAPPQMYSRTDFRSKEKPTEITEADVEEIIKSRKTKSKILKSKRNVKLQKLLEKRKDMASLEKIQSHVQENQPDDRNDFYEDLLVHDYNEIQQNINQQNSTTKTDVYNQNKIPSECSYVSEHSTATSSSQVSRGRGVEIAPPPTFDYYGPSYSRGPKRSLESNDVEQSIEAGLKFLRKQMEKK